jgi:hypothetical protein
MKIERRPPTLAQMQVTVHYRTKKALLVSTSGEREEAKWVPKSQIYLHDQYLTMPEWLAVKAGLIAKGRH